MYAARCFPPHAAHTLGMDHVTCIDQSDAGTKMPQCCGVHATVQPSWPCEMWKHYLLQWHHFCHFFVPPHYVVVQKSRQKRWHPRINASTFHMAMTQDSVIICGGAKKMAKTTPPQSVTLLCLYALNTRPCPVICWSFQWKKKTQVVFKILIMARRCQICNKKIYKENNKSLCYQRQSFLF